MVTVIMTSATQCSPSRTFTHRNEREKGMGLGDVIDLLKVTELVQAE